MSQLRLLATGKSLIGMSDPHAPYRMRAANLLPRFGSAKNPFAQPKGAPAAAVVTVAAPENLPVNRIPAAILETGSLFDAVKIEKEISTVELVPFVNASISAVAVTQPVVKHKTSLLPKPETSPSITSVISQLAPQPVPTSSRFGFTNIGAAIFKKIKGVRTWVETLNVFALSVETKKMRAKLVRESEQTELSLEKIKVMRNDLSDADFQVIGSKGAKTPAKPLSLLTERWLKAGQTQLR